LSVETLKLPDKFAARKGFGSFVAVAQNHAFSIRALTIYVKRKCIGPQEPNKNILALSDDGAILAPMGPAAINRANQPLERINLRLPAEIFRAIDADRARRAGIVSRNT
jgi:hypothetical protein